MVRNLAGNLAIVTSKEPVRSSLVENIQAELVLHGMAAVSSTTFLAQKLLSTRL